jgi:type IV pilus assembly protein PilF
MPQGKRAFAGRVGMVTALVAASFAFGCASAGKKSLTKVERARMWLDVANGALSEGDPIGALENIAKAEKEAPDLPDLHHSRALAYHIKKEPEIALEEARKAVALDPTYSEANNTLGKLLLDRGLYDEAIPRLSAADADPLYRGAYKANTNLGIIHYRQGKYGEARHYFNRAIDQSPLNCCIAYYYRGHLSIRESRVREAIRDYEKATQKLCSDFADAHFALAVAFERSQQTDRARRKYLEIQDRYPNTPLADQAFNHLRDLP